MKKLTIGIPTYDDYDGVYFSLQSIRVHHSEILSDTEFVIIDNNPTSSHGKAVKKFCTGRSSIKYIEHPECRGPADSKNQVFIHAETPYVLCMDGHVLFENGSLKKLLDFYLNNPDTKNLHQGPLVYDCLTAISTHFDPVWRGHMYGTWATDKRGKDPSGDPFEIPMQGTGVFSCAKDAWLGFNDKFRGFGGEEGYIHDKFKAASAHTLCLPFLRWIHRFDRPEGVKYPLHIKDRIRNYFIGFLELGKDVQEIIDHFGDEAPDVDCEQLLRDVREGTSVPLTISPSKDKDVISPSVPEYDARAAKVSSIKFNAPMAVKYLKIEFFADSTLGGIRVLPSSLRGKEFKASIFSQSDGGIKNPESLYGESDLPCVVSGVEDFKEITLEYDRVMHPSCINVQHDNKTHILVHGSEDGEQWTLISEIN